jgi:aspartate--ammonia ligase
MAMHDKKADLVGPGIGDYAELEKILPHDYHSLLSPKETQIATYAVKDYIEQNLCKELNLIRVTVPLIVDVSSGVNDDLDRDGSRTPVRFRISNDHSKNPVDAEVVQAATKWKRMALKQFDMQTGEGLVTDMRAVRKDYFLDHDHSACVDQWDWELAITKDQRNVEFLKQVVRKIWKVLKGAEEHAQQLFPQLKTDKYPDLPDELTFLHAEEILERYPDLPRQQRETRNPVTKRRHELTSMRIRVTAESLKKQLEITGQLDMLRLPYHQAILNDHIPLSIGGGIGQSRTFMLLLKKAHLGEVSATVWPGILKEMCRKKNIHVIE